MNALIRFLKYLRAALLALAARAVVRRYRPKIVMITGSVGKTSTKDAVAAVLARRFFVRKSEKSYNSEIGLPLTVLGAANPWGSILGWLKVARTALTLLILPNHYPNLLVLEVGADRPGDLARILAIATPDAVVVTRLPEIPVHVEAYESPAAVREEEFLPAYALAPEVPLVISAEDAHAALLARGSAARVLSYGEAVGADTRLSAIRFAVSEDGTVVGMTARASCAGVASGQLTVLGSVGKTQLLPAAAALTLGAAFGIECAEALAALATYEPPPGRGRLFAGVAGSIVIDDSYNASPAAAEEALATLKHFPRSALPGAVAGRRIAVLGDMLELGRYSVAEHERIGKLAASSADIVVSVGVRARGIAASARAAGMGEGAVESFDDARAAAEALPAMIHAGDVVLVKGSQSVRAERIVAALLARAADSARLVRQERQWLLRS